METKNKELTINRTFNAPLSLVWAAWTDVEHIKNWWGPKGFTNPVCNWNPETGSKIYIEMKAPDGVLYPMDGEFSEIKLHEKIVFSAGALDKSGKRLFDIQNTIHFMEEGDKTKLTLHFEISNITAEGAPYLKGQEMGWNMSLDKLAILLDNLK
jgi:uncharacterized protein YndB with AHSA1/START domain